MFSFKRSIQCKAMLNIKQILFVFLACVILILHFSKSGEVKLTNVICKNRNESWLTVHHCRLRAINRHKTTFNFNATFAQPTKSISVVAQFFKKANGYKPWLYKISIDVCRFLRKPYNPIAVLIFRWYKEFSNMNHTCPYMGLISIDGLYIEYNKAPNPWPSGDFLLRMTWIIDKIELITVDLFANVKEDS